MSSTDTPRSNVPDAPRSFEGDRRSSPSSRPFARWFKLIVRAVVSIALIAAIVMRVGDEALLESLQRGLRWKGWFALAILAPSGVGHVLTMLRTATLVGAHQVHMPKKEILRSQLMGTFFNQLLPTSIGGDACQVLYLGRYVGRFSGVLSALLIARVLGVVAMCLLIVLGAAWRPNWIRDVPALQIALPLIVVAVVTACGVMLLIKPRTDWTPEEQSGWRGKWQRLVVAADRYRKTPRTLAAAVGLSLALQVEIVFQYWLFSRCLGVDIGFEQLLVAVPMVTLAATLPVSLNGVGVREWVMVWICSPLGIGEADAALMAMLFVAAGLCYAVVGAIVVSQTPLRMGKETPVDPSA